MIGLHFVIFFKEESQNTHADSHWWETLPVRALWSEILSTEWSEKAHDDPHCMVRSLSTVSTAIGNLISWVISKRTCGPTIVIMRNPYSVGTAIGSSLNRVVSKGTCGLQWVNWCPDIVNRVMSRSIMARNPSMSQFIATIIIMYMWKASLQWLVSKWTWIHLIL